MKKKELVRSPKDLGKLVSFLTDTGLERELTELRVAYLHQRGVIAEPPHLFRRGARFSFSIQWFDGNHIRKFRLICKVSKDGEVLIDINNLHFTEETLPQQPRLHQLLLEQIGDPIVQELK